MPPKNGTKRQRPPNHKSDTIWGARMEMLLLFSDTGSILSLHIYSTVPDDADYQLVFMTFSSSCSHVAQGDLRILVFNNLR
jgi:hypothetical protein